MRLHKIIPLVSVVFTSVFCTANVLPAEEFKPFLTMKIASMDALTGIAKKISTRLDQAETLEPLLVSFKEQTKGITFSEPIGFAAQCSKDDFVPMLFLPISDMEKLSHPVLDILFLANIKQTLKKEGGRFTMPTRLGNILILQKKDYVIAVQEKHAAFAESADPKKIFTGHQEGALLGMRLNVDNLALEAVHKGLVMLAMIAAAQKQEIDVQAIMKAVKEIAEQVSSASLEIWLDDKNLDGTLSWDVQTKKDSDMSSKCAKLKNAKTVLAGFVNNLPTTIVSMRSAGVLTKKETEEIKKNTDMLLDAFLGEITDSEDEKVDDAMIQSCRKIADLLRKLVAANLEKEPIDTAFCLDSQGVLLCGTSAAKTDEIAEIARLVYASLGKIKREGFDGKDLVKTIDAGLKQDYKTVGGASLTSLKLPLADLKFLPVDDVWKKVTLHLFYAVKKDTSVVFGLGFDGGKAEQVISAVLEKSEQPVLQKECGTFSFRQLGHAVVNKAFPLENIPKEAADVCAVLAKAGEKSGVVMTAEFSGDSFSGQAKIGGQIFDTIAELMKKAIDKKAEAGTKKGGSGPVLPVKPVPFDTIP